MAELTLISPRQRQLKPLVEAALQNELRLLEAGIRRTDLQFAEWIGEYRLLERLREKADILREIQFAN